MHSPLRSDEMITFYEQDQTFYLQTKDSTYIILIDEQGHLEHVYYGPKISPVQSIDDIRYQYHFEHGSATSYSKEDKGVMLNQKPLEISWFGKGDYREPTLHLELPNGSRTIDLTYQNHQFIDHLSFDKMPQVRKQQTLQITLKDEINLIEVQLFYTVDEETNSIVRNLQVINHNDEPIVLDKVLSFNLDMLNQNHILSKLDGAWIRERHIHDVALTYGTVRFDSKKGVSSSDHNPFFVLKQPDTNETYGNAYGFALVYSGNFEVNVEINPHNFLRINMGINSFDFRYPLEANEVFVTPEVILSYSPTGLNTLSTQFHELINTKIIPKQSQQKDRPIVINNWEATYFDFNQKKLLAIAKKAHTLGIELFCLDDGWFAKRNDDFSSLGDWYHNPKKLPRGLNGIAQKINQIGLDFGLWVEPEMVNEDSDLYRQHPDWAVKVPNMKPSLGRNQLILDFTNPDVIDYLKTTLHTVFSSANIVYVKWDMNRNFSDVFSSYLSPKDQGKFNHLYVLGLYELLDYLVTEFPHILFESCSSGGNRFDLGMLYYMPQTWTSDNTDALERLYIQEGTSMCYPLSSISNHVSGERSHQVFRHTPLETRFHVAAFGVLGYEMDLTELTPFESKIIKAQIEYYKHHRHLFQYGDFIRLRSVRNTNYSVWMVINKERNEAILGYFQKQALPNPGFDVIHVPMLQEGTYQITGRTQFVNIRTFGNLVNRALPIKLKMNSTIHNFIANRYLFPIESFSKILTHDQLANAALILPHKFTGTDHGEHDMILEDYGSRMYHIKQIANVE